MNTYAGLFFIIGLFVFLITIMIIPDGNVVLEILVIDFTVMFAGMFYFADKPDPYEEGKVEK